jgi:hypothetical protein
MCAYKLPFDQLKNYIGDVRLLSNRADIFKEYQTLLESTKGDYENLYVSHLLFELKKVSKEGFVFEIFANTNTDEIIPLGLKKTVPLK